MSSLKFNEEKKRKSKSIRMKESKAENIRITSYEIINP